MHLARRAGVENFFELGLLAARTNLELGEKNKQQSNFVIELDQLQQFSRQINEKQLQPCGYNNAHVDFVCPLLLGLNFVGRSSFVTTHSNRSNVTLGQKLRIFDCGIG